MLDGNWLSIVEYARKFAVSDMTVRRRIKNGKLKAVLRDGKYYIPRDDTVNIEPEHPAAGLTVVKAHPQPNATFKAEEASIPVNTSAPVVPQIDITQSSFISPKEKILTKSYSGIPENIKSSLVHGHQVTVSGAEILSFCQQFMETIKSEKEFFQKSIRGEMDLLEAKLKGSEASKLKLSQEVEDLKTLVKLLESSS